MNDVGFQLVKMVVFYTGLSFFKAAFSQKINDTDGKKRSTAFQKCIIYWFLENYTKRVKSLIQANQNLIFQNELSVKNIWPIESFITSVFVNKIE